MAWAARTTCAIEPPAEQRTERLQLARILHRRKSRIPGELCGPGRPCYHAGMRRALLALLIPLLAACSSMQPVRLGDIDPGQPPAGIGIGDRVEVVSRAGEEFEFTVTELNPTGVGGEFGFIPFRHMRRLSVRRPGAEAADLGWLWGLLGVALVAAVIVSADSVSVCSPGPCPTQ